MKLPHPFVQLPLLFDAAVLEAEIAALGEGPWMPHPQGFAGNSMLPLVAVGGDPANESFAGRMEATPHLARCPYLQETLAATGVVVGRTRLMRLSGHSEVTRHADRGYYWADRVRVHIPVVTQPTVRFDCEDQHVNMAAGECWIFDTWRQHRVLNDDTRSRIHLVVDTVGGDAFWAMVEAGRTHAGTPLTVPWNPRRVQPTGAASTAFPYESTNVPVVMSPWEIQARMDFLLDEAAPHPALAKAREVSNRFARRWHMLWAQWGTDLDGLPAYRATVREYMATMMTLMGPEAVLRNELGFMNALTSLVHKVAAPGLPVAESMPARAPASIAAVRAQQAAAARPAPVASPAPPAPRPMAAPAWGIPPVSVSWSSPAMPPRPAASAPRPVAAGAMPVAPVRLASAVPAGADPLFDRPVFVVSSPRSGSTMLFEALAGAPGVNTIGGESHALIERIQELNVVARGFDSNRLSAAEATPEVAATLRQRFHAALRDREGRPPLPGRLRMLEKTPKNSLRIPFLASVFPESTWVYLYRDPREVIGSMMDAWTSGRFCTYPNLPGWTGTPWSLVLVPGWRDLVGRPLAEVVATQWETTTRLLLDDLEALPAARRHVVRYDRVVADPQGELGRVCAAVGLGWDRRVEGGLPLSRYTLTQPSEGKWRKHAAEIEPQLPRLRATMDRAARFAGL